MRQQGKTVVVVALEIMVALDMPSELNRMTALWRFHDNACDCAMLIYTFARSTTESRAHSLYERQLIRLLDLVHQFSFSARRAIERAAQVDPDVLLLAQSLGIHKPGEILPLSELDEAKSVALADQPFWWVINRVIHSRNSHIVYRTVEVTVEESTGHIHETIQPVAVEFASDRDVIGGAHLVALESLAHCYLGGIGRQIESALER